MAMRCPQCNRKVRRTVDAARLAYCLNCGWQQRPLGGSAEPGDAVAGPAFSTALGVKLALAWLFALALVFAPYAALLIYVPELPFWIHLTYWLVMFTYLAAAATTSPRVDTTNLGWAGGMIDNPFTWEDDLNRHRLAFAIALIPGKIAVWAIRTTWRLVRGR